MQNTKFLNGEGLSHLWDKIEAAIQAASGGGGGGSSDWWTLLNKTTTVDKTTGTITETNSDGTAVTTSQVVGNVKTITTVITPTAGNKIYTQTTVITETNNQTQIVESYTESPKPQQGE